MAIVKVEKSIKKEGSAKPKDRGQKKKNFYKVKNSEKSTFKLKSNVKKEDRGQKKKNFYKVKNSEKSTFKLKSSVKKEEDIEHSVNEKKAFKRKFKTEESESDSKKVKLFQMKKKARRVIRKKKEHSKTFERSQRLKALWEELRKDDCEEGKKNRLLEEAVKLIRGHANELTYAHDTVRVLECVFGLGTADQKAILFDELKESILQLAKSKYAKFFLIKVLRHGSKEQKNQITKEFYSKVIELISHTEAAEVVEVAFNECASAAQRTELVQEFYGPSYRYFKSEDCSLSQLLQKEPDKKASVIQHMKEAIIKLVQKSVIRHSIVHFVLREFVTHADQSSRAEIIEALRHAVVEILHTKDGARAAMHFIWHGSSRDRKVIVKSFKTHVVKVAKEEHGHMVLLAIFDSVDDTKLVEKHIITELLSNILDVSQNLYGRKVLLYLLSPRDKTHFCPDIIKILEEGDNNETSKKDAAKRRLELKECVVLPLALLVAEHISNLYKDNSFCLAALTILKHAVGHRVKAFKSIAELVASNYTADTTNLHIIESPGSNYMLKKLVMEDKFYEKSEDQACFSKVLIEEVTKEAMRSWIDCNRGCFLLISLLETEIPSVIKYVKRALKGCHTQLSKRSFRGAEILLNKIKQ